LDRFHWDNNASDWDKWLDDVDPAVVADQYLADIDSMRRGIILMHDNMANVRRSAAKNRGLAFAQALVPALKTAGYTLCRVDEIPEIAAAASATPRSALCGVNRAFVSPQNAGGGDILVSGAAPSTWEKLVLVPCGSNCFALQAPGGQYFTLYDDGVTVTATATEIGDWETFEAISTGTGTTTFRTFTGDFLMIGDGSALVGNGGQTDPNNEFTWSLYGAGAMGVAT
jgi:hypothetical protein